MFPIRANEKHRRRSASSRRIARMPTKLVNDLRSTVTPDVPRARDAPPIDAAVGVRLPCPRQGAGPLGRRLAALPGEGHPVWTYLCGIVLSFAAIAGLSILAGLLVTRVLLHVHGVAGDDESVRALPRASPLDRADRRVARRLDHGRRRRPADRRRRRRCWSPPSLRHWRLAGFLLFALAVESASYRATTLVIHRHRPAVHRLEQLPVNASYPSGHTAASIAVYWRPRAAAHLADHEPRRPDRGLGGRAARSGLRRLLPDVPRHAPPARRRRRRDRRHRGSERARPRQPRANLAARGAEDDEGRRHRARRQDVRRRPARAAAGARAPGRRRPALDRGAEEPLRARSR